MALMRWGALCVVLVVLSSASTDGESPGKFQKGYAHGFAAAQTKAMAAAAAETAIKQAARYRVGIAAGKKLVKEAAEKAAAEKAAKEKAAAAKEKAAQKFTWANPKDEITPKPKSAKPPPKPSKKLAKDLTYKDGVAKGTKAANAAPPKDVPSKVVTKGAKYKDGFANGYAGAVKKAAKQKSADSAKVVRLKEVVLTKTDKIGQLQAKQVATQAKVQNLQAALQRKDHTLLELEGRAPPEPKVCPIYKPPKKGKGIQLVRTIDPRVTRAIRELKENPDFQEWVRQKPMDDMRTSRMVQKEAFRMYRGANERAKVVTNNFKQVVNAMFSRAKGLVNNKLAYGQALTAFRNKIRKDTFAEVNKVLRIVNDAFRIKGFSTKQIFKVFKRSMGAIRRIYQMIKKVAEMRGLRLNKGFKFYRSAIAATLRAELGGYNDDMLGGRYSDDSIGAERVGLLPVKTMEDTDRDDWMKFLVKLTKQGEQIMQQSDLLTSFPIPAQMDISVLKGVPGTKVCKHSVDKGQVCKVFIELYGKYTVGTKTEPTNTFPLWKKWGANSDNKPEALRKALTPTEGGAQWSCQRVTGDSKKMQSSYECTLLDYGPNGLGFVGFKGSTRLIPTGGNGKKTCVRWSRTKEMVAPTRVICCPKFDTKCPKISKCGQSYDRKKAAALYEARKKTCDFKFPCARYKTEKSSRTKSEKSSGIVKSQTVKNLIADGHKRNPGESEKAKHDRSECVEKHTDCLTLVNWSKDVVNTKIKHGKTKEDLSPSVTASRIVQKRFCQSMWRNSKQETNYTGSAEVIGSFIPEQLATLEYNYTAETTKGQSWTEATLSGKTRALPPGVLDRPLSSDKAFWPEPKWGFITPTRHRYCTGPCAEWFPQPYGCQTTARVKAANKNVGRKMLAVGDTVCPFAKSRANNFHVDRLKDWARKCTPGNAWFKKKYRKICKFSWHLGIFNTCGTKQMPRGNLQRNGKATAGQFGFGTATSFRRGFSDGKHPRPSEESLGEANSEQSSTTVGISHGGDSSSQGKDLGSSQHTGSAGVNALLDKGVELEGLAKSDMEEIKRVKAVSQSHQNYARQLTKLEHLGLKLGKAEEHLHHLEVQALKRGLKIGRSKKTQFSIRTVNTTTTVGKSKLGESNHVGWGRRRRRARRRRARKIKKHRWHRRRRRTRIKKIKIVNPMIAIRKRIAAAAAHARRIAAAATRRIA